MQWKVLPSRAAAFKDGNTKEDSYQYLQKEGVEKIPALSNRCNSLTSIDNYMADLAKRK